MLTSATLSSVLFRMKIELCNPQRQNNDKRSNGNRSLQLRPGDLRRLVSSTFDSNFCGHSIIHHRIASSVQATTCYVYRTAANNTNTTHPDHFWAFHEQEKNLTRDPRNANIVCVTNEYAVRFDVIGIESVCVVSLTLCKRRAKNGSDSTQTQKHCLVVVCWFHDFVVCIIAST